MKRVVVISGPSCVGKGPLLAAARRFGGIEWRRLPVVKSRESRPDGPRPDELALWDDPSWFRPASAVEALRGRPGFVVGECQGLPQAIDLDPVLEATDGLFVGEAYFTLVRALLDSGALPGVDLRTIFLSPVSRAELALVRRAGLDEAAFLIALLAGKLRVRAVFQGSPVREPDLVRRAADAPNELAHAHRYHAVLPSHAGEGDPRWQRLPSGDFLGPPVGEAAAVLASFLDELRGAEGALCERPTGDALTSDR